MDYKSTLLMPKTDYEMKGKLATKEPKIQSRWEEENLYEELLASRQGNKQFILHDGPPYANGSIHIGHCLNKILKDFVVRSKSLQGYHTPYIPGWDTHGLPIETAVTKSGIKRKELSVSEFKKLCEEYAIKQVANQITSFKRLGSFGDYDNPYLTLQKSYEAMQLRIFAKMAMDGLIYRGLKPVYWSPSSETALAEAEIEYHEKTSPSIYLKFNVIDGKSLLDADTGIVIWTTTPWTIPANLAICLHPNVEYGVYETNKGKLVFAKALAEKVFEKLELEGELIATHKGSDLEYITYQHVLYDRTGIVINGDHVTTEDGTGCVHTAPGHGVDDFIVGQKYNLEVLCPVDAHGKMTARAGSDLEGLFYDNANKVICEKLEATGTLLKLDFFKHSYPHDWRTNKPVIYRATDQWFASIDIKRADLLKEIDNVNWIPTWGHTRLYNMIRDRGDWCISRQRSWGVPIPIIYDENKEPLINEEIFKFIVNIVAEHGTNAWLDLEVSDLLPESYKASHPNYINYTKETDIMDVWFDSGSSHTSVLVERGLNYPADLYLEGSDQYRGWFNSSLILGTCYHGISPFKQVLSHGFVLDAKGNKMSKSKGNVIDPLKIINVYGADILRYWVASVDYQSDVRISDDVIKQNADAYRKVRNTNKFILGNLNDFDDSKLLDVNDLEDVDKYIMIQLSNLTDKVIKAYNDYDYNVIYTSVNNFIVRELSAFYMDFTKDILYIHKQDDKRRMQVQTVLYNCVNQINLLLAPILPHTAEEVYDFLPKLNKFKSVHFEQITSIVKPEDSERIYKEYTLFMKHRDDVLKAIEVARAEKVIGKSLEAMIKISYKPEYEFIKNINDLQQLYIVSNVEFCEASTELDSCFIDVSKYDGYTCPRCWNVVDQASVINDLCPRCNEVINN